MKSLKSNSRMTRALAAREAALRIIEAHGQPRRLGPINVKIAKFNGVGICYWDELYRDPDAPPEAVYRTFGLDLWYGRKVLNLGWDKPDGEVDLNTFKPGEWETLLCGAHGGSAS